MVPCTFDQFLVEVLRGEDLSHSGKLEKLGAPRGVKTSPVALRFQRVFKEAQWAGGRVGGRTN